MKKMHQYLLSNGFTLRGDESTLQEFIGLKGAYRYALLAKIVTNNLPKKHNDLKELPLLDALYIFDISIRREILRIAKPLEVHVKGKISNYIFSKNNSFSTRAKEVIKPGEMIRSKDVYTDLEIPTKKRIKYEIYNKDILGVVKKENVSLYDFLDKLEFGNLIKLLRAMSDITYKKIFRGFKVAKDRAKFINDLDFIRKMRNAAAHHNVFLNNKVLGNGDIYEKLDRFFAIVVKEWGYHKAYTSFKKRVKNELPSETNKKQFLKYLDVIKEIFGLKPLFKKYNNINKKK